MNAYGMPGVGGALGQCCYCGETFIGEILFGTTCRRITIGEQDLFIHTKHKYSNRDCFSKLKKLAADGRISLSKWSDLPEASPLREPMKKLFDEQEGRL